jgi:Tfp pilus assembly protein PilV
MSSPIANLKSAARNLLIKLRVMFDRVAAQHAGLTPARSPVPSPPIPARRRRAITLLEVLISMFIMTVGLLSVASLVPVGKVEIGRADRTVRASACGRAAIRELKVRGILDAKNWARPDTSSSQMYNQASYNAAYTAAVTAGEPLPTGPFSYIGSPWEPMPADPSRNPRLWSSSPFPYSPNNNSVTHVGIVIDPLGVAANFGNVFPYGAVPATSAALPRMTSGPYGSSAASIAARASLADAIFRSQDELVFSTPTNADALPTQVIQSDSRRLSQGDYSWLATVVPDPAMMSDINVFDIPCIVSVAIFHKRNLGIVGAGERSCELDTTLGNVQDEVRLKLDTAKVASQYGGDGKAHLNVTKNSWIMLAGWVDFNGDGIADQWHFRWHRVIAADEVQTVSTGWTRNLTLSGPFTDMNSTAIPASQVTAFLFDGIVNVYEKNMTLEYDSM